MMKTTLKLAVAAAGLATVTASPALAIDNLTANGGLTTNYVFRGITQSAKRPAVFGGLDYTIPDTGFSVGTWASSIDFGDDSPVEIDLYGNYNFTLGPVGASVGVYSYLYPYSGNFGPYNVFEIDGGLSYDFGFAAWSAKAYYAPTLPSGYLSIKNGYNPDSEYWLTTGLSVPVASWLSISGNLGYEGYVGGPVGHPNDSYVEWDIGATLTYDKYSLDLRYIDTDTHTYASYTGPYFQTGPFYVATFTFRFP